MFPGAIITKLDASYIQGIPDVLILWGKRWAVLEFKKYAHATKRPNQDYYVDRMNNMSFARFIYPENETEVLNEIQQALSTRG